MLHWYMTNPDYRVFDQKEDSRDPTARDNSFLKLMYSSDPATLNANHSS